MAGRRVEGGARGSPYVDLITEGGFTLVVEGFLEIPNKPGLGITLNREALKHYSPHGERLFDPSAC